MLTTKHRLKKLFAFSFLAFLLLFSFSLPAIAADEDSATPNVATDASLQGSGSSDIELTVPLGGSDTYNPSEGLGGYVDRIYKTGLILGALLGVLMIVIAAIRYIVSAGDPGKQADAKGQIVDAIIGLILLIGASVVLFTLNPNLLGIGGPGAVIKDIQETARKDAEDRRKALAEAREKALSEEELAAIEDEKYALRYNGIKYEFRGYEINNPTNSVEATALENSIIAMANHLKAIEDRESYGFEDSPKSREAFQKARDEIIADVEEKGKTVGLTGLGDRLKERYLEDRVGQPQNWVDTGGYLPEGGEDFIFSAAKDKALEGVQYEAFHEDVSDNPQKVAAKLWEIRNRAEFLSNSRVGYRGAREGYENAIREVLDYYPSRDQIVSEYNRLSIGGIGWGSLLGADGSLNQRAEPTGGA